MGNSESIIVPPRERKHRSGRRDSIKVLPIDQEYYHDKRRQYNTDSGSDASSQRPRRKIKLANLQSSLDDMRRPTGVRYSRDYLHGGYGSKDYVVDQGSVFPGMNPSFGQDPRVKPSAGYIEPRSSGYAYNPTRPNQRQRHNPHHGGLYVSPPRKSAVVAPSRSIRNYQAPRQEPWSRRNYYQPSRET